MDVRVGDHVWLNRDVPISPSGWLAGGLAGQVTEVADEPSVDDPDVPLPVAVVKFVNQMKAVVPQDSLSDRPTGGV
ncbi:hypothetical protein ABZ543_12670 [Streptomyces roseifaciens]